MRCQMGYGECADPRDAVAEACRGLAGANPDLLLFFSDSNQFAAVSQEMAARFPGIIVMGAATFGSFSPAGFSRHGVNVAALQGIRVQGGHIDEITRHPMRCRGAVTEALDRLGPGAGAGNTCCFLLNPAGTESEELVLDTIGEALKGTDIPVFGGSASSEADATGMVSLNGVVYSDSSLFVLIHLDEGRFTIYQENIFAPMDLRPFTITWADVEKRILYELNGHPTSEVLCRALGVTREELPEVMGTHPLGRIPGERLFIDEVQRVNPDGSLKMFCRIFNQTRIVLLEPRDFEQTLNQTLTEVHTAMPDPVFSIIVNCFSRTRMFLEKGLMDDFTRKFGASMGNYIGLTSHGEQLGRYHLNQTLLILSFGGAS